MPTDAARESLPRMPSGHSVMAIGLLTLVLLEIFTRKRLTARQVWGGTCASLAVLAPVPYSRVYLNYHTTAQIVTGSILGAVAAAIYFLILFRIVYPRFLVGRAVIMPPASLPAWLAVKQTYRENELDGARTRLGSDDEEGEHMIQMV